MIIHSLKLLGFRIMGEPTEISFPTEGRIGILGQNESGKSTILQAIEYALYGLKKGAGDAEDRENLVTWGKNEAKLEIKFTSGQDTFVLRRVFGVKSGHRASLTPVIREFEDKSNSITSLKEIAAKIEQITGMDRDSFTKLIYIKQKDLDALRELAKSKREQLVNKVMGIEIFDSSSANVKADKSELEVKLNEKNIRLDSARNNKEEYERKLGQKVTMESSITSLQQNLEEKKTMLNQAKSLLEKYNWLNAFNSTNEMISSLKGQIIEVKKNIIDISGLEDKIKLYSTTLDKYKPEILELQNLHEKLWDLEIHLRNAESSVKSTQIKKQETVEKSRLSDKEIELLSKDLATLKHHQLVYFIISLLAGLGMFVVGFILASVLIPVGFIFFIVAAYAFRNYLKLDKLITMNTEVYTLTKQLEEQEEQVSNLKVDIEKVASQTSFRSCDQIDKRLSVVIEEIKKATDIDSISGIGAVLESDKRTLGDLMRSKPQERKQELQRQVEEKESQIISLEETKPPSIDELQYDKDKHKVADGRFRELQNDCIESDKEIQKKLGIIQQLKIDLELLKPDFDSYPMLEQEIQTFKSKVKLLERVLLELSETSKELRNKVIPHARFIINQILPTLTDGRYSDFEITEDLKFKVHSNEAGGYKEREIFSGGTQDQFLIALRLAFTQSILDSRVMADKYSLLMDECISSSDDVRKQGIFEVLDAMKQTFSQIFVIAHEDISDFVDYHIVLARNEHGYMEIKSKSW